MNLFWNIAPVHKDDPVFIHNMLYRRDFYKFFVSHIRVNSVIHFDIESNYQNHFLKNIRNNENYNNINQNNEDGSYGEWGGEDSSDDSDNYDDTHQGENHVEEEEEGEELESDQVYPLDYIIEQSYRFPVMVPIDCLLTKKKLIIPAKFVFCQHFQCFELRAFIKNSCRTGCWKCPVCSIGGDPFKLIIDRETRIVPPVSMSMLQGIYWFTSLIIHQSLKCVVMLWPHKIQTISKSWKLAYHHQRIQSLKVIKVVLCFRWLINLFKPPPIVPINDVTIGAGYTLLTNAGYSRIVMLWVSMFMVMEHHSRDQCGDDNFFHFNSCADKKR
ncbi:hypothetical protein ACTFIW_002828 [Dictyostelium discoideum]